MVDTTTTSPVPAETITPTEVVDTPLAEVELPPVGGNETVQGEVDSNPFENPLTEIDIPLTDIDVPSNGPEFLKPPNFLETNTNPPETGNTDQGLTDEPSVTDPPFVNPENQDASGAGLVSPIAQDAAGGIPAGLGIVPAPPDTVIEVDHIQEVLEMIDKIQGERAEKLIECGSTEFGQPEVIEVFKCCIE